MARHCVFYHALSALGVFLFSFLGLRKASALGFHETRLRRLSAAAPLPKHSTIVLALVDRFLTIKIKGICVRVNINRRRVWVRPPLKPDSNIVTTLPKPRQQNG